MGHLSKNRYFKTNLCLLFILLFNLFGSLNSFAKEISPLSPFVVPWDDNSNNLTNMSSFITKPAGKYGFVYVRDGHLYAGDNRIRFFGTNICEDAAFPSHPDAEKVAAHLARLGINCVRFHHLDSMDSPRGLLEKDKLTIDPVQMDKLDYFIYQLKVNGIYVDLNTHVGRKYPGMPKWVGMPEFFKGIDNFYPPMIQMQKDYAKALLTHYNPYTKSCYINEPAVAFIEINNENSLLREWHNGTITNDSTPDIYKAELKKQWNSWLKNKYNSVLKNIWIDDIKPLGNEMLSNRDFSSGISNWIIEQHGTSKISPSILNNDSNTAKILCLNTEKISDASWHGQLAQGPLNIKSGQRYTLTFWAKSDVPKDITVYLGQAHTPWKRLWAHDLSLIKDWKKYEYLISSEESDTNAKVVFSQLAVKLGSVYLSNISLKPGGTIYGLKQCENPNSVNLFSVEQLKERTQKVQQDWLDFLYSTENTYWTSMYKYIKEDLMSHSLIIGTQNAYSPYSIQSNMDVIDSHNYWQHPSFPNKPWDSVDWQINNVPMAGIQGGGAIGKLALSRVVGKPFIVSEYNHPAPNTYSSEAYLLLSAYASLQDWDGIFSFDYNSSSSWDIKRIRNFFDIDQHPTKLVTLAPSFAMFVRGDVSTSSDKKTTYASYEQIRDAIYKYGNTICADKFGMNPEMAMKYPIGLSLNPKSSTELSDSSTNNSIESVTKELVWEETPNQGVVTVNTPMSKAIIGSTAKKKFVLNDVSVDFGKNMQNWAALTLTKFGESGFNSKGNILITATGYVENTNMGWKDATKSSVGNKWGDAPSLVEVIQADITLPVRANKITVWGLDDRGNRKSKVKTRASKGKTVIPIGPWYKTLWYEVKIK